MLGLARAMTTAHEVARSLADAAPDVVGMTALVRGDEHIGLLHHLRGDAMRTELPRDAIRVMRDTRDGVDGIGVDMLLAGDRNHYDIRSKTFLALDQLRR